MQFMTNEAPQPDEKGKAIGQKGKFKFLRRLRDPDEQKWQKELHLEKPADEEEEIPVELEEPDDGTISSAQTDVEQKCLRLLGLLEEYYARGDDDKEHFKQAVLLSSEANIDALLKVLEGGTTDSLEDDQTDNLHKGMAVKIQELLSVPEVKNKLFQVLKTEGANFKRAYPILRKVARRKKVTELAPREIVKLYLKDKRTKGKLHETTKAAIGNLEKHRKQAQTDAQTEFTIASPPTKGWLIAQELLEYKKQLKENGFAKTESRKKLVDRVLDGVAHGEKMFLVGSTGTGKTQLAMLVADLINETGFEIVSWHEGTTPRDLFGYREIGTDDQGRIRSATKKGPVALAITDGKIVIHDEYTAGTTRSQLAAKGQMNAKAGQQTHLPGFNGELFTVPEGFGEIFTGNPRDERTKAREHMDPAILRMLSGMKVSYMPSEELFKVILAELIDDVGFLHLSRSDVELIHRVTKAAELMQMCHNREIDKLQASPAKDLIAKVFGDRLDEVHMDNNFLDTGTALRLFQGWDLEKAKGRSFAQFLHEKISGFLEDPKSDIDRDEKKLAQTIFEVCNVLTANGAVHVPVIQNDTQYILPSKLAEVLKKEPTRRSPLPAGAAPGVAPGGNPPPPSGSFEDHIDRLPTLTPEEKAKLKEMMSDQNYQRAVAAAQELQQSCRVPTKAEIIEELKKLTTERLKEICEMMEKPTLLVVPANSFDEKVEAMNQHKHYIHQRGQENAYVNSDSNSPYRNAPQMARMKVSIVDGFIHPKPPKSGVSSKLGERRDHYTSEFTAKNMKHIDKDEYAVLMQMSLIEAQASSDNKKIIDNWESGDGTLTFLDPDSLTKPALVAFGYFSSSSRRVRFSADFPELDTVSLRGRAAVQVFEY